MFPSITCHQSQQYAKALSSLTPIFFCLLVFLLLSGCATSPNITGQINQYENNVFTNEGQSSVKGFEKKLRAAHHKLEPIKNMRVWVGYHGDSQGNWYADFNEEEKNEVKRMAAMYPNATLIWTTPGQGLSDQIIKDELKKGSVFFTWCDSDNRVKRLMETP